MNLRSIPRPESPLTRLERAADSAIRKAASRRIEYELALDALVNAEQQAALAIERLDVARKAAK